MSGPRRSFTALIIVVVTVLCVAARQDRAIRPAFGSQTDLAQWDLDGSGAWQIADGLLTLSKAGTPAGPIRRPAALAILKTPPLARVRLEVDVRSTAPLDVVNRDMEIVFGYESPTRFYYVHLAGITDSVHNGVFLVNGADRRRIDEGKTPPQIKDQAWHHVRLERDGSTGRIQVFVDASPTPAFDLVDTTIRAGRVGLGSFDDTGEFRNVIVTERQ